MMNADWIAQFDSFSLVAQLFEETAASRAPARAELAPGPLVWTGSGPSMALPPRLQAVIGLEQILAQRRSVRSYKSQPVPLAAVADMLEAANDIDERTWPELSRAAPSLSLLLLARRVKDLAPAVYVHVPSRRMLMPIAAMPDETTLRALFLQEEFSLAPAVLVVVGSLSAAVHELESHAHRELLLRSGAAAHRAVLTGLGLGLGSCVFAGLVADSWRKLVNLDGYNRVALFGCAIGYPREEKLLP
jgi:nitroreductase